MPEYKLPVYDRKALSYPAEQGNADEVHYAELADILTEDAEFDAHFSCYSAPYVPYRLNKGAIGPGNIPGEVPMVLLVFDVDDEVAHKNNTPARAEWYAAEAYKIGNLMSAHDCYVYHTKGGYRIVAGWLPEPFVVSDAETAELWKAVYQTHVNALKRRFGIVADPRCKDWQRQFRLPRALRDGVLQDLPTYGDPRTVGVWTDEFWQDEDVVGPEEAVEVKPRPTMRTEPELTTRKHMARQLLKTLKPAVQGGGAEDALWAACNEALVSFDLPVEGALEVLEDTYLPRCDVDKLGPEHFLERARKKLEELNCFAEKKYGWRIDQQERADNIRKASADSSKPSQREDSEEKTTQKPRVEWLDTTHIFAPLPDTKWVVSALEICPGRPVLWTGYGGSGKTIAMQALLLACASGNLAWGSLKTNHKGIVCRHIDQDQGKNATLKRYQRLARGHKITAEDLGDRLKVASFPNLYLSDEDAVDAYSRECEGVDLALVDALRGAARGEDENDSRIRGCVDNLTKVSEKVGTSFVLIHHSGKSKDQDGRQRARGSSAILDGVGAMFLLDGTISDAKLVTHEKPSTETEGGRLPDFELTIEDVTPETRVPGPSAVRVVYRATEKAATTPDDVLQRNREQVFEFIRSHRLCGVVEIREGLNMRQATVTAAVERLLEQGRIDDMSNGKGRARQLVVTSKVVL